MGLNSRTVQGEWHLNFDLNLNRRSHIYTKAISSSVFSLGVIVLKKNYKYDNDILDFYVTTSIIYNIFID